MAETPRPGEVWEFTFKDGTGNATDKDRKACFIYEKDGKMYLAWFSSPWSIQEIEKGMIDGQNEWRKVYSPAK